MRLITVEGHAGQDIDDFCAQLTNIAEVHQCKTVGVFNEITLTAYPSHKQTLAADYWRQDAERKR